MIIKKITSSSETQFHLTFDDGPDPVITPRILDLLNQYNSTASFFVIGTKAQNSRPLIREILQQGSKVYSHSIDHHFGRYFAGLEQTRKWLHESIDHLSQITGVNAPVFRPPAGIVTPPLLKVAREQNIRLILWNHRFYDSVWPWTEKRATRSLQRLLSGDIVLLHDAQAPSRKDLFLRTLQYYLSESKSIGCLSSKIEF